MALTPTRLYGAPARACHLSASSSLPTTICKSLSLLKILLSPGTRGHRTRRRHPHVPGDHSPKTHLYYMGFNTTIYHVWRERNRRLHQRGSRPPKDLFKTIYEEIRVKILQSKLKTKLPSQIQRPW